MRNLKCFSVMVFVALNPFTASFADAAGEPVVTPLMVKDLADMPGKEMLMVTVDYPPELWTASIVTMRTPSSTCWKGRSSCRSGAARRSR